MTCAVTVLFLIPGVVHRVAPPEPAPTTTSSAVTTVTVPAAALAPTRARLLARASAPEPLRPGALARGPASAAPGAPLPRPAPDHGPGDAGPSSPPPGSQPSDGTSPGGPGDDGGSQPDGQPDAPASLPLPLRLHEALPPGVPGVARHGEVATLGLPFPAGEVPRIESRPALAVQGADTFQARTLATWPDGSVKWALLDVALGALDAGQVAEGLTVVPGAGASPGPSIAHSFLGGQAYILDSGPLQAVVLRQAFNLFALVKVDGQTLVAPNMGVGLYGTSVDGGLLRPGPGTDVIVEENGPARAVLRADGPLVGPDGQTVIDFTCRIAARAGSRELDVTLTLRNASAARPSHARFGSVELLTRARPGGGPIVSVPRANDSVLAQSLSPTGHLRAYQARSSAPIDGAASALWRPHIPYAPDDLHSHVQEGWQIVRDGVELAPLGNPEAWPDHGWLDLTGPDGGVTVAIERMPYQWPASLEASGGGLVVAGLFPRHAPEPYTLVFQQHESRRVVFAFHAGPADPPVDVARRLDLPVTGRAADYGHYDRAGVFPYRLLTPAEQSEAYALMGIEHAVQAVHPQYEHTRYLYKGTTGGKNNHARSETLLAGEWLRLGQGGSLLNGLQLALWKAEWQIPRSDDFHHAEAPPVTNPELPHTEGHQGDDEHRYREGIALAYHLTGDRRYRDALFDEAEVLTGVSLWPHERSMYQTLRALATVADFTKDPVLDALLAERLEFVTAPLLDVELAEVGFGWEDQPGAGLRRYFVFDGDNQDEKPPGEHFQARGFISASLGPVGFHLAARRVLSQDPGHPLGIAARERGVDLAHWTRHELYPWHPDPAERRLAYSYAVTQQVVTDWEDWQFHPILLGMAEAWRATGDSQYLEHGVSQVEAHAAVDNGPFQDNLHLLDSRLDCQHFFALYREWALGVGD